MVKFIIYSYIVSTIVCLLLKTLLI